jgi:class 3 adenylate cyclase
VTFLFTDVEGSTKLLQELGAEAYAEALTAHRRVIRGAIAAHAESRSTLRATRSSLPFRLHPVHCARRLRRAMRSRVDRSASEWGSIRESRS